jgi:hypothetical protein
MIALLSWLAESRAAIRNATISLAFVLALLVAGIRGAQPYKVERPMIGSFAMNGGAELIPPPPLVQATSSIGTSPKAPMRPSVQFAIHDHDKFRYNVILVAIRPGGVVKVWRMRDGKITDTGDRIALPAPVDGENFRTRSWPVPHRVEVPPLPGGQFTNIEVFRKGDTLILEQSEGMYVTGPQNQSASPLITWIPGLSEIDRVSNAPTYVPGIYTTFVAPGDVP